MVLDCEDLLINSDEHPNVKKFQNTELSLGHWHFSHCILLALEEQLLLWKKNSPHSPCEAQLDSRQGDKRSFREQPVLLILGLSVCYV